MNMTATKTKERPILFKGRLVLAILEDRKSVTRRIVKWKPYREGDSLNVHFSGLDLGYYFTGMPSSGYVLRSRGGGGCWNDRTKPIHCPYGRVGDHLWVRETWACRTDIDWATDPERAKHYTVYRANGEVGGANDENNWHDYGSWRPSIHMPRCLSRLTLEITSTRIERLHEMRHNAEEFEAEGVQMPAGELYPDINRGSKLQRIFEGLWDSTNGEGAWARNDWVWVIGFRKMEAQ